MSTINTTIVYLTGRLQGGPYHGQKYKIRAGLTLSLPVRERRGRNDVVPVAIYEPSAEGRLVFAGVRAEPQAASDPATTTPATSATGERK